ncbi:hypothetical protein FKP32DRAFT_1591278 [Trametes sanguinea]|nr:hypothetical protein FKP32DRAFT_1591278 [Trametes sanguinea]
MPQTIGYSLFDPFVGLLAWIYEKLVGWTDGYPLTDNEFLELGVDFYSMYWFSRAGPAVSLRIKYEMTGRYTREMINGLKPNTVPVCVLRYPREHVQVPDSWEYTFGKWCPF